MPGKMLAFHYDLKHAMWSQQYMESYADRLSAWGYDTILLEVEDKFRHPNHPGIAATDAFSPEQISSSMAALRQRGLKVIPLIQTLGHVEYVLTKPGYEKYRESAAHDSQYNPLSLDSRALVIELIDDLIAAAKPEKYFHIGGDETWNLGQSEKCKPVVAQIGTGGLYLKHMLPIINHVIERGLRPILWADIALTHPEIIGQLPRELVLMDWDYWTAAERWPKLHIWGGGGQHTWDGYQATKREGRIKPEFIDHLEKYAIDSRTAKEGSFIGFPYTNALRDMGFDVIVAPATRSHGDSMGVPMNSIHTGNCFAAAQKGNASGLGSCVTSWAVRYNHPELSLPSAFAAAQGSRSQSAYDAAQTADAFTAEYFGQTMPEFLPAMLKAEVRVPWCESREMFTAKKDNEALAKWREKIAAEPGAQENILAQIADAEKALLSAKESFSSMRGMAKKNAASFDYWLEGVEHTLFCAAFAKSALENSLAKNKEVLLQQLNRARAQTRQLFASSFPANSLENELAIRYAFHEAMLKKAD